HRVHRRGAGHRLATRTPRDPMIRALLALLAAAAIHAADVQAPSPSRPYLIYAITFRGMTDVEKGFQDYFAARRIPVQITFRDLNRDSTRMAGFVDEIRKTRPDLKIGRAHV